MGLNRDRGSGVPKSYLIVLVLALAVFLLILIIGAGVFLVISSGGETTTTKATTTKAMTTTTKAVTTTPLTTAKLTTTTIHVKMQYVCPDQQVVDDPSKCPAMTTTKVTTTTQRPTTTTLSSGIASNSFNDVKSVLCDKDATDLAKSTIFDSYKGKYVQWTGIVSSVDKTWGGSYYVAVQHCPSTFTSDIMVYMRDDQLSKLLSLKKGDTVTYKAKLLSYSSILTSSATDGVIVSSSSSSSGDGDEGMEERVTCEEYNQIRTGMTYRQVVDIVDGEGELQSESEFMGITTSMYAWSNPGSGFGVMSLMFQDNRLMSKSQMNIC